MLVPGIEVDPESTSASDEPQREDGLTEINTSVIGELSADDRDDLQAEGDALWSSSAEIREMFNNKRTNFRAAFLVNPAAYRNQS